MKIKSFGCSFLYGSELSWTEYKNDLLSGAHPSRPTWPALIANQYSLPYENHAWPGIGNLRILEQVLTQAKLDDPAFFFINWSWADRFDYIDPVTEKWNTFLPKDNKSDTYYKNFYSDYQVRLTNLSYINTAITILNSKNIAFCMTAIDPTLFEIINPDWKDPYALTMLQDSVHPCMTWFEGKDFLSWSQDKNLAISENWHPLEEAHRAAADYLITIFDKQSIVDPAQRVRA